LSGNDQNFLSVLISEPFGPADAQSTTVDLAGDLLSRYPASQEKVLCKRTMGHIDFWALSLLSLDPYRLPALLRAALCKLDEGSVWDPAFFFPSLFGGAIHQDERVLWTGTAKNYTLIPQSSDETVGTIHALHADLEWDQSLNTSLETGESLWLLIEQAVCTELASVNWDINWHFNGWTRALFRE